MPVLPIIDLLIMVGWTSLMGGALLKAVYLTTSYRPTLLGMGPMDFVLFAGICLVFALTLAARTWVKYHEPRLMSLSRRRAAFAAATEEDGAEEALPPAGMPPFAEPGRAERQSSL